MSPVSAKDAGFSTIYREIWGSLSGFIKVKYTSSLFIQKIGKTMKKQQLEKLVVSLKKDGYAVYAPVEVGGRVLVKPLAEPKKYKFTEKIPYYSYKAFFFAPKEALFDYEKGQLSEPKTDYPKIALLGVRKIDLKAVAFYDEAFAADSYYQKRRKNIFIIGHDMAAEKESPSFLQQYKRDKLEDLPFDIFLMQNKTDFTVYSGTIAGAKALKGIKYNKFNEVKYSGPRKNDEETLKLKAMMDKTKFTDKMWQDLGKLCVECGQCTLSCPTCYCFAVLEEPQLGHNKGEKIRVWDACYYNEFSRVTGEHRFLDSTNKKIHFWYTHKFSRDPKHLKMLGCVGCERCTHSCPVDIDIRKVLASASSGGAGYSNEQPENYPLSK